MNKTFEDCRDRMISAGLTDGQLHDLSETTVRLAGFMKTVRIPSDSPEEAAPEAEGTLMPPPADETNIVAKQPEQIALPSVKNVPSWIDQAALAHTEKSSQGPDIGMGYTMYMPNSFDQLLDNCSVPSQAQGFRIPSQTLPFDFNAPNLLHQEPPTLSLSPSAELPPPKTYSFQERTLARRLHRACLEAAYHLLLDPSRRPQTFERVFKLSLLSRDRVRMASSLKQILNRGLDEPLDFWDAPTLHIGGAGTHYPDRQRQRTGGHPQRDRAKFHLGVVGPQMLNLLENVVQSRPAAEVSVEIEGFEGEWFDPYDIEGYLESRGIHIDPMVSFVEAVIDDPADTDTAVAGVHQQQYSPSTTLSSSSGGTNNSSSTLNPASNSGCNKSSSSNNDNNPTPPYPAGQDPEQWSALQLLEPDLERWREVENTPPMQQQQQQHQHNFGGLGNVGFSDADTGSWMNFFDSSSSSSSDQFQNNTSETAAVGMRNSNGAFLPDLYGAAGGSYDDQANATIPSPPLPPPPPPSSKKKVVIIDVAKFVKGKHPISTPSLPHLYPISTAPPFLPSFLPSFPLPFRISRTRKQEKKYIQLKKLTSSLFPKNNSPNHHRRLSRPHARFQAARRRSRAGRFFV